MRVRRAVAAFGLIILAAVATYGAVLAFPTPLFGYSLRAGRIVVFSRRPLDDRLRPWLAQSLKLVERSSIDDPGLGFTVFELYQPSWYRFFNGPYFPAMARHSELGGHIFVPRFDLATGRVDHFDGRSAPVAAILAHEMTHRLMQHRLGLMTVWRLPWWKREGYAELIGEGDDVPLEQRVAEFVSGRSPEHLLIPRRYFSALIAVRYLIEAQGFSFDDFVASSRRLDAIWAEIRTRYSPIQPVTSRNVHDYQKVNGLPITTGDR